MLDLAHIGERIRECRKKKMMTIRVLGEYTGLSAGYLSMLEQNKTSPNVDSLARICEALDIDIQYALEGEISSLHPGDSVYIKSRERHSISNPGKEPCVSIWVYHRDVPRLFGRNENKR
ncbi:helix-turn-helix domain-containing protein [Coprococcus comes]|uniref:helix-turn-helix domain-containing protein n=1 Tax=Coprococcus comes TaxID=410072 RepID=UPI00156D8497|nr:XRE family transcriptional regulator [Coprococcus comes]NSF17977.1 helix-turn-helix domain-containing protein [Coprococcus comes]